MQIEALSFVVLIVSDAERMDYPAESGPILKQPFLAPQARA